MNARAADDLVGVFRDLYRARFAIEEMRITRKAELTAPPTGDGNNTGAFACRPTTGGTSYSQHASGLAVDVNPFQNPYTKGALVLPELASIVPRPWLGAPRDDHAGRAGRPGVHRDRLGLGRQLAVAEGLPALQRERPVTSP